MGFGAAEAVVFGGGELGEAEEGGLVGIFDF